MAISISILSLRPPCYSHVNIPFHNSTPCLDCDYRAAPSTPTSTVLGPGTAMLVLCSASTTGATTVMRRIEPVRCLRQLPRGYCHLAAGWTSITNLCSSLQPSTGFFLKSSALQVYTLL